MNSHKLRFKRRDKSVGGHSVSVKIAAEELVNETETIAMKLPLNAIMRKD